MMNVAQQIRHIASVTRWCREGAFGKGFDMDFAKMEMEGRQPCTLEEAITQLNQIYDEFIQLLQNISDKDLNTLLPDNPIVGPVPRFAIVKVNNEHTAHHRGALTVYIRLLGRKPSDIYAG
jgi:uncharacterized damage-inducible protein DinB